jgi:glutamine synthetase
MLLKDTAHRTVFPVWGRAARSARANGRARPTCMMLPDPSTFRVLPWAPHTGWMLCDIVFADGRPMPLSTRQVYRRRSRPGRAGYEFFAGLEVEFHLFKLEKTHLGSATPASPASPARRPRSRCSTRATST